MESGCTIRSALPFTRLRCKEQESHTRKVVIQLIYLSDSTYMSSAYAPGAKATGEQFHVSETVSLLGISLFCLGLAFGPMIGAPLSESAGRLIVYRLGLPIATLFLIGAAVSKGIASVVICRFFAGVFGSPALSVGGGTMADMWPPARRGPSTALFVMAPFMGPCIGKSVFEFTNSLQNICHIYQDANS